MSLALAAMLVATAASAQTAAVAVTVVMPHGLPDGARAASVICRDARGGWFPAVDWREVAGSSFALESVAGRCRVLVRPERSTAYLSSAEIQIGARTPEILMEPGWLRSIDLPRGGNDIRWSGIAPDDGVECARWADAWRCWFVPMTSAGVVVSQSGPRFQFALVRAGDAGSSVSWSEAAWGRLVRARSPSGQVSAAVVVLRDALKQGAGRLKEARPAAGVSVTRLGREAFWLEGAVDAGMHLELRGEGAATTRVALAAVMAPGPGVIDAALRHQEVITGEVRSRGSGVEGATVLLSRLLDAPGAPLPEDERVRERIAEIATGAAGEFRFDALDSGKYEIFVVHPSLGRARALVNPTTHARLLIEPRAVIRGKVLRHGIPLDGAVVHALPSLDALTSARNPAALGSSAVRTDASGRFEVIAPDEGRVTLSVTADSGAVRIEIGDAAALPKVTDVGEIRLEEPAAIELLLDLPEGCELRAAGPLGTPGLTAVTALPAGRGRWALTLPHAGRWIVAGVCAGREIALEPAVITVPLARREPIVLRARR